MDPSATEGKDETKQARVALAPVNAQDDSDEDQAEDEVAEDDEDILNDWPDDTQELDLIHARIKSCSHLRLPRFAQHLTRLCLRQNLIAVLEETDFGPLDKLQELDLYDNKIKSLGNALAGKAALHTLDLSFNLLRGVPEELTRIPALRIIYFVQNKISHIDHLGHLGATLQSLELGGNRIRTIENLEALVNLEELWLGKNKITKLENLGTLQRLRILSIQSNRITKLEGLDSLANLEELYISHNGLAKLEGLEHNLKLTTLDVGNNQIGAIENITHLKGLEEFWASYNKIPDLKALDTQLRGTTTLKTIYLEGNLCQTNDATGYRRKVILALPQVTQVDATYVRLP